jgi:hypothetical protein
MPVRHQSRGAGASQWRTAVRSPVRVQQCSTTLPQFGQSAQGRRANASERWAPLCLSGHEHWHGCCRPVPMPDDAAPERGRRALLDLAEQLRRLEAAALELSVRCSALLASTGVRPEKPRPPRKARARRPGDTP